MLKKLREKLAQISADMRSMHKAAEDEDRGFSADEQETWSQLMTDYDETEARIKAAEAVERLDDIGDAESRSRLPGFDADGNEDDEQGEQRSEPQTAHEGRATPEYRDAYMTFLRDGSHSLTQEQRQILARYPADMGKGFERRAQATSPDSAGGFAIPEGFAGFVTETMQDFSGLLGAAGGVNGPTLLPTASGNLIPFPTNDDTGNAGTILAENAAVPEQDTVFGQRTLTAYMYTSRLIRVSLQLLQDEAINLESYLGNILGKRIGRALSPHLAAGTGTGQPTGISVAATDAGVNMSVAAGITYGNLLDIEHGLDPAYRQRGAQWAFNDATLRLIKGLLDANNRPIWLPGDTGSLADNAAGPTLNGYGYVIDQGMDSLAVGDRPIVFGDLSEYYIRQVLGVTLFRFNERYMDNLQIGFMGYARYDGNLIDTSAVVTDVAVA